MSSKILDVGRRTYERARAIAGNGTGKSWDELTDSERLWWMQQIVHLAFTSQVFA